MPCAHRPTERCLPRIGAPPYRTRELPAVPKRVQTMSDSAARLSSPMSSHRKAIYIHLATSHAPARLARLPIDGR